MNYPRFHPFGVPITYTIRLTGVDTPASDVVAPLGLRVCALYGGYAHPFAQQGLPLIYDVAAPLGLRACALCGICTPVAAHGNPEGVIIIQARV